MRAPRRAAAGAGDGRRPYRLVHPARAAGPHGPPVQPAARGAGHRRRPPRDPPRRDRLVVPAAGAPASRTLFAAMSVFPAAFDADARRDRQRPPAGRRSARPGRAGRPVDGDGRPGRSRAPGSRCWRPCGPTDRRSSRPTGRSTRPVPATPVGRRPAPSVPTPRCAAPVRPKRVADLDAAVPHLRAAYDHALAVRDIPTVDRLTTALLVYAYHRLALEPADWATAAARRARRRRARLGPRPRRDRPRQPRRHRHRGTPRRTARTRGTAAAAARRMAAVMPRRRRALPRGPRRRG